MANSRGEPRRHPAARGPSQRQLRVGELLRQALSEVLSRGQIADPELVQMAITVTEVRMTPDLKRATCFVMPLGGGHEDDAVKALARNAGPLNREVCRRVQLKFAPRLLFQVDRSFDQAAQIDAVLAGDKVRGDLRRDEDDDGAPA